MTTVLFSDIVQQKRSEKSLFNQQKKDRFSEITEK